MASPPSLAILDDYASIATPHFQTLGSSVEVTSFPTTLQAHIPEQHDALINRLKPYTIISSMRERTKFPCSILEKLPNLKVLLTTGMKIFVQL